MGQCILCGKQAEHGEVCNKCIKDYEIEEKYDAGEGSGYNERTETDYSLITAYKSMINKYSQFEGRSRRSEYWYVVLGDFLISAVISLMTFIFVSIDMDEIAIVIYFLYGLFMLFTFVPRLALTVRRLHDVGKSKWCILLEIIPLGGLVLLAFLAEDSQRGKNKYGPSPKKNY